MVVPNRRLFVVVEVSRKLVLVRSQFRADGCPVHGNLGLVLHYKAHTVKRREILGRIAVTSYHC